MRTINRILVGPASSSGRHIRIHMRCFAARMPFMPCMAFFLLLGGGTKVPMTAGDAVPAAQGMVVVRNGHNGNIDVDTRVRSLANPGSLTPPEGVYVVWFQPNGQTPVNEGTLKVGKNLNGALKTETPFQGFEVIVTAEKNAQVKTPAGPQVLTATVSDYRMYMDIPNFIY